MNKASKEDNGEWCAVVFDEFPDMTLEKRSTSDNAAQVSCHQDQKGHRDGKIGGFSSCGPLPCQHLYALLEINKGHVKAKDVAAESSHISQCIARIRDGKGPMHDQGPADVWSACSIA